MWEAKKFFALEPSELSLPYLYICWHKEATEIRDKDKSFSLSAAGNEIKKHVDNNENVKQFCVNMMLYHEIYQNELLNI